MSQQFDAIFENGVFRPEKPVNVRNGERVSLTLNEKFAAGADMADVIDLLDVEFMECCRAKGHKAPSLESVRQVLAVYEGSLADRIGEERDER